jgi:hypothetical protein
MNLSGEIQDFLLPMQPDQRPQTRFHGGPLCLQSRNSERFLHKLVADFDIRSHGS